ncbi:KTSC domain-containing protein [Novosphingobium sp. M1R2S20]|uniref:KTSC domain-containing protein n=1 Tax=Novosphingobium rhizovicinum TaxID=3228928 RepID=A0ABV3RA71_9SPHN
MPSTAIREFAYDGQVGTLEVTFVSGRRYRYFLVPDHVAQDFAAASSKGGFFNAEIRDRYPFQELSRAR